MTDEFTHLVYKISSPEGAINSLSPDGYELASDELAEYLDFVRPNIPLNIPVVLEITGLELGESEKQAVIRGLSAHFLNRLDETAKIIHHCWVKTLWFALCLILSSALIFLNHNALNEVLVQYLYIPFWFFGYRVITFPLLDLRPVKREQKRLEHFMNMKVLFTRDQADELLSEHIDNADAFFELDPNALDSYRVTEGKQLSIDCMVHGMDNLLNPASTPGRELMSSSMASYLEQIEHFISADTSVRLTIKGGQFAPSQQRVIDSAIRHYYDLCIAEINQTKAVLFRKVMIFVAGVVISSAILFNIGNAVDVAFHELLIIVLWFFADYLIEFVILDSMILRKQRRTYEQLKNLSLSFASLH